jgi:hypothetical protein
VREIIMLMTEEEAKSKWCPHARVSDDEAGDGATGGNNRWLRARSAEECMCIGSGCMAWRWRDLNSIYEYRTVTDDRFAKRIEALPEGMKTDAFYAQADAIEEEAFKFAETFRPEPPEDGFEFERTGVDDEANSVVVATFRRLKRGPIGYCGAFGKPEGC